MKQNSFLFFFPKAHAGSKKGTQNGHLSTSPSSGQLIFGLRVRGGVGRGTLQGETDIIPYSAREREGEKSFFSTQFFARFVLRPGDERGGVIPTFALMLCARVIKKQFLLFALGGPPLRTHCAAQMLTQPFS